MLGLIKTQSRLVAGFILLALALAMIPAASHALAGAPANSSGNKATAQGNGVQQQAPARPQATGRITSPNPPAVKYVAPDAPISFILDDGTIENAVGFGGEPTESAGIWLNRFTPSGGFPITLQHITIFWPGDAQAGGPYLGNTILLLVYADTDGDGNPGNATKLAQITATVGITNAFQTYNINVAVPGPGDIYLGFEDYWAEPGYTPFIHPAGADQSSPSQRRSWVAAHGSGAPPDRDVLSNNDVLGIIDDFGIVSNFMIRADGNDSNLFTATRTPTATVSPTPGCSDAGWFGGAPAPSAIVRAVGVWEPASVVGGSGRFYAMGGRSADPAGNDLRNPRYYDPGSGTWTVATALIPDVNTSNMACAALNGPSGARIYCVGGSTGGGTNAIDRVAVYDPVGDTMTTDDVWPGDADTITLPGGFAVVNNKLYILGGFKINTSMSREIWEFNPTASSGSRWTLKSGLVPDNFAGSNGLAYIPAANVGGVIYTGGGAHWISSSATIADDQTAFSYNPATDTVNDAGIPDLPTPGNGETRALNVGGKVWLIGGGRTAPNPSANVLQLDPANLGAGWTVVNHFDVGRRNFAVDTNGLSGTSLRIFLVGGYSTILNSSIQIYDPSRSICTATVGPTITSTPSFTPSSTPTISPTVICPGSWTQQAQIPAHVMDQAAVVQGGILYNFSGVVTGTIRADSYKYTPGSNTWAQIASLPGPRENASAVTDGTFIYILGGNDNLGNVTSSLWRYDPGANTYITLTNYTTATRAQGAAYLSGKIYKIGGATAAATTNVVEAYDIAAGTWSTLASYPQSVAFPMVIGLSGLVYVAGGENGAIGIANTYAFNPGTNTWNDAGIAELPRTAWGAASDLLQGKWVVAGGFAPVDDDITQGALSWDPGTNTWSQIDSMLQPRGRLAGGAIGNAFYAVGGAVPPFSFTGSQDNQRYINICAGSTINGHLTWQNVSAAFRPSVTGTLSICVSGAPQNFSFTTDTAGNFTVTTSIANGVYHWLVKGGRHLSSSSPTDGTDLTISGGHATQEFGTQKGGNTSSDNIINATDFNALKAQFGQSGVKSADADYNGVVNASDFNIQKSNFGQAGHAITCP